MKDRLTMAKIDPYSSEGRSEIYCRFVLEYPPDNVSMDAEENADLTFDDDV